MARLMSVIIFALAAFIACEAASPTPMCPNVKVMENFEPEKYMGLWYENRKTPFVWEVVYRCITARYNMNPNGKISIINRGWSTIAERSEELRGSMEVVAPGKLSATFEHGPVKGPVDYFVLGTDYESFSVTYHCNDNLKFIKGQTVWILTRDKIPTEETLEKAYAILDAHNIDRTLLQTTHQASCAKET